ncbi:hypothetical protein [Marilutibacter aestuarii]|uniref:Holin n=1 Tax=Marilutibacter aestuarii TaxID=1706195 RepID=A0A508AS00_9GAMM|nr:hypothetical protein [Lysobacter aestuarii]TQD51244.1 hypothetical protein FKV25_02090 [Lysobacter aestuarii]
MGLIARKLHSAYWMARYWAMDKYATPCRRAVLVAALVVLSVQAVALWQAAPVAIAPGAPRGAWVQVVIQIALLVISAYIAYASRPKPQVPDPVSGQAPETKDGKALKELFGTVWVDDSAIVGWANGTPEPIRKKGGKK